MDYFIYTVFFLSIMGVFGYPTFLAYLSYKEEVDKIFNLSQKSQI